MRRIVSDEALDILFRAAGNRHTWRHTPVSDTLLQAIWELVSLAPVGAGGDPARIVFVRSEEAKARLSPLVSADHRSGILTAPIAAIIGQTADDPGGAGLRAAYLILAARALGLDCGPVWRFDARHVDEAFFSDGALASAFVCALGYGQEAQPGPAQPRREFGEACAIL
jgi:3-hydroxypropanoate dehydrogenase